MVKSHPVHDQLNDLGITDSMDAVLSFMINQGGMGAILVLKMSDRDYAPSQISRWIEENDAKILGLMISQADQGMLKVNIKLNTSRVKNISRHDFLSPSLAPLPETFELCSTGRNEGLSALRA